MTILSDGEIDSIAYDDDTAAGPITFARAIEAATIAKLSAGVSVEPHYYWEADGVLQATRGHGSFSTNTGPAHGWIVTQYFTLDQLQTAIAAARVQAIRDALNCYSPDDTATDWADKIGSLIGVQK